MQERHAVRRLGPAFYDDRVRDVTTRERFGLHLEVHLGVNIRGIKRDMPQPRPDSVDINTSAKYKRCSAKHLLYLVAILDVASRKVLSFRVSNTMTPDFCVEALEEAIARFGAPEIMNTDQGSQFTSAAWTDMLKAEDTSISMDGKGRWIDNVFIERLWRSVKYEDVYLRAYENGREVQADAAKMDAQLIARHWMIPRPRWSPQPSSGLGLPPL